MIHLKEETKYRRNYYITDSALGALEIMYVYSIRKHNKKSMSDIVSEAILKKYEIETGKPF